MAFACFPGLTPGCHQSISRFVKGLALAHVGRQAGCQCCSHLALRGTQQKVRMSKASGVQGSSVGGLHAGHLQQRTHMRSMTAHKSSGRRMTTCVLCLMPFSNAMLYCA